MNGLHVLRDAPEEREQDDGPDDEFGFGFGFDDGVGSTPSYATGRRRSPKRAGPLDGLQPPPKDVAEIVRAERIGKRNAYAKVDFADWAALEELEEREQHRAQVAWMNLAAHQEIRNKQATGIVRTSTRELTGPLRAGRDAIESGIATLVRVGIVAVYQASRRQARVYVMVPVYMRFRAPDTSRHSTNPSGGHVRSLSGGHVPQDPGPSGGHVPQDPGPTTPTLPSGSSESSSLPPSGSSTPADHAAAAPTTLAGAAGASRPAAAAARAAPSPLVPSTWDAVFGPDNYTWEESAEHSLIEIETKLFYNDETGTDRAVSIGIEIDTITQRVLVHFPRSRFESPMIPWEHIQRHAGETWQRFAGVDHKYSTWDYLICCERWLFAFAKKGNTITSPVGFLSMVDADILDKHRWGDCCLDELRFARPKAAS